MVLILKRVVLFLELMVLIFKRVELYLQLVELFPDR
jgi:hypothetical protein